MTTDSYTCMLHKDFAQRFLVMECIRYQNDRRECAVMKFIVLPLKGEIPRSSVHYSPSAKLKPKEASEWHELQTRRPDDPMTEDNDCLQAFNNLSERALVSRDYYPGCKYKN
ncbi:uncharacterized protein LOC142764829 isoform X2 [Rhipicephalus microplus]